LDSAEPTQRHHTAAGRGRGGGRNIIGGSKKFLYGMVRSQKPLLTVPPS